jgi:membrane protease YdiL (CAAX protease family)
LILILLKALGAFLVWNIGISIALTFLNPLPALAISLVFAFLFLELLVFKSTWPDARRRWAILRLRPLRGEALRWTLIAVPVLGALSWSLGEVYLRLIPVPPHVLNPFDFITGTLEGRLALAVLAVAIAPVVEESIFRGMMQYPLERRWNPAAGIAIAALLFAIVHVLPWILPLHFILGVVFGWAVYATRSLWAGIILHVANNALAVIGLSATDEFDFTPTIWQTGLTADWWVGLLVLVMSGAAAVYVGRRMWEAGRSGTRATR